MPNRAARRLKHKLILAPFNTKLPFQNIRFASNQKKYTCTCGRGWLSISGELPVSSWEAHVKQMQTKEVNL